MKQLLILRHAKSSWSDARLSDHARPLNKRGRRDAPTMGGVLADEGLVPGLIITSSAVRATETTEEVAIASDYAGDIIVTRDLYHADPESYLQAVRESGGEHQIVMVVGHNPGIEELVEQLSGEWHRMPTAALAYFQLPISSWKALDDDVEGQLMELWLPRELAH